MGVYYDCEVCKTGRAGEFEKVNGEHVCSECQEKAMEIGISQLKCVLVATGEGVKNGN